MKIADPLEDFRLGVAGDVVRYAEGAECSGAFRVHAALKDHLSVKVRELLEDQTSCRSMGPRGPAVMTLLSAATGAPKAVKRRLAKLRAVWIGFFIGIVYGKSIIDKYN